MSIEHDYPELPPISLSDRLILDSLIPAHFALSDEALQEAYAADHAIHAVVARNLQHLGQDVVEQARHAALRLVREYLQRVIDSGDVTRSE
ncbi:hypothetical protein [Mycobacteroides abscessus]|jgi:hypothetical protein|uniref:hypothetical protein n=1 Tax=Mycobacteroides abscessus TaxID=36809 RepID=UPI0005E74774|nr:hypothetical protein [Mycobacteroides abscessus]CPW82930.1 Uncharacterised protein [Mycobacteroides abscessus]